HLLDDEACLVHTTGWIFAAVLIERDAAVFRNPLRRIRRIFNRRDFRHAAFVDEDQSIANVPIIISTKQHFALSTQTKRSASKGLVEEETEKYEHCAAKFLYH